MAALRDPGADEGDRKWIPLLISGPSGMLRHPLFLDWGRRGRKTDAR